MRRRDALAGTCAASELVPLRADCDAGVVDEAPDPELTRMDGRMTPTTTERDRVVNQRLFVSHAAPSHPLSAPDPHLTLKLMSAERERLSRKDDEGEKKSTSANGRAADARTHRSGLAIRA